MSEPIRLVCHCGAVEFSVRLTEWAVTTGALQDFDPSDHAPFPWFPGRDVPL